MNIKFAYPSYDIMVVIFSTHNMVTLRQASCLLGKHCSVQTLQRVYIIQLQVVLFRKYRLFVTQPTVKGEKGENVI